MVPLRQIQTKHEMGNLPAQNKLKADPLLKYKRCCTEEKHGHRITLHKKGCSH